MITRNPPSSGMAAVSRSNAAALGLRALVLFIGLESLMGSFSAAGPQIQPNAPIRSFSLPSFNEKGFRTMLVRGREAIVVGKTEVQLQDMTLTVFSGDEHARVETVFLSSSAKVRSDERAVFGDETVRVITDEFELIGTRWRYEHDPKRILITSGARVVFKAELKDILR